MSRFPALPGISRLTISRRSRRERSRREGRSGDQGAMGGRGLAGPHRDAVDAGRRFQRRSGRAGRPAVTDRAEPDPRFIVVYETEPEQSHRRTASAAGPSADDGRKVLRGSLDEDRGAGAVPGTKCPRWSTSPEDLPKTRRTAPSRSPPASASRNMAGRQSPGSSSRPGAKGLPHRVLIPCRRTGWRTRRASKMPDGVTAAVWQGREGTKLGTDEPMCRNIEAVKAAHQDRRGGREALSASTRRPAARSTRLATIRRRRRRPKRPMSCSRRTRSCSRCRRRSARTSAWSSSTRGSGRTASPATRLAIDRLDHELEAFPVRDHVGNRLDDRDDASARPDRATARRAGENARRLCAARAADRGRPAARDGVRGQFLHGRAQAGMEAQGRVRDAAGRQRRGMEGSGQAVRLHRAIAGTRGDVAGARKT